LVAIAGLLKNDAKKIQAQINEVQLSLKSLNDKHLSIKRLLETKKGEMTFSQVVEGISAEQTYQVFDDERSNLESLIKNCMYRVSELNSALRRLINKKRSQSIQSYFQNSYWNALQQLEVPFPEQIKLKLTSRPNVSGSGGPRSMLAYYAAIWTVCSSEVGSYLVPLVLDAPNQQGQDQFNLPRIIGFATNHLPSNTQIILGSENEFDESFDMTIMLDKQYNLLRKDFFEAIHNEIEPLLYSMYAETKPDDSLF